MPITVTAISNPCLKKGVLTATPDIDRLYLSDRIDQVVTNRFFGPLIMAGVLLALYHVTFAYSAVPVVGGGLSAGWAMRLMESPDGLLNHCVSGS